MDDPLEEDPEEVEYEKMMTGANDDDEVEEAQVEEAKVGKVAKSPYAPTAQEREKFTKQHIYHTDRGAISASLVGEITLLIWLERLRSGASQRLGWITASFDGRPKKSPQQ